MSDPGGARPARVATAADDADRAVLGRIAAGELDALEELYDRYRTMAYSIAYRITGDPALAEDVTQDAFLGAWRNAARYVEGRGSVKTWLLSIFHHRAIDAVRRRRPTTELPEREDAPPALTLPDVWAEVAGNLDRDAVRAALGTLSDVAAEGAGPRGMAAVGADGTVVIAMRDLAPTSGTEVYEAWVIGGDGVPVPIGGVAVGSAGTATFTATTAMAGPGVTLALTREPGPGATAPTLPIVSVGAATAPST